MLYALLALVTLLACACVSTSQQCPPAISIDRQPQIFVMSDISNEPDDTMSFIRLLLHSDQYNITGLTAVRNNYEANAIASR